MYFLDLVVPVIIPNFLGLSEQEKNIFCNIFFFSVCGAGWLMFFEFLFSQISKFVKFLISKIKNKK